MNDNYDIQQQPYHEQDDYDNVEQHYSDSSDSQPDYSSKKDGSQESQEEGEGEEDDKSQATEKSYDVLEEELVNQKPNQKRITSPFMTKFQKAKIIGVRAVQISKNSPLYLNNQNITNMNWDPLTIAEKELSQKKLPFIIRRYLPDGSFEDWKVSELKTFD